MNHKEKFDKIKRLLKKMNIDVDKIDIESEIDDTLTFEENWSHIKRKYLNTVKKEVILEE